MPLGSILLGLALAILVVPFVISPLLNRDRRERLAGSGDGAAADRVQHNTLFALRDLDFDFRTGKIAEEDYAPLRQRLVVEAAQALQAVDDRDLDAEIETAVRAVRSTRAAQTQACPHCRAPAVSGSKFCSQCGKALEAECPGCHEAVRVDDKFCVRCGAPLKLEAAPVP